MATPTPTLPSHPSSASKRAVANVSTPSQLGFSPAPRSVPSPAATRKDQAGKTPVNHPTTSSHGSKTLGGTPMIHNLSQQGHASGSSPGANMLSFGTPVGLGVEGITPGAFNMSTPAMGVAMGLTLSDLGVPSGTGAPKRNEDEERRVKMRNVLKSIGKPKGRVSRDAIARISRRAGFDNAIEEATVSIAGKKVLIDVALEDERPKTVSAVFATENAGLNAQTQVVGDVLLQDLQKAGDVTLTAKLDHFAANLERLASIDRLSSEHFDAFEALSGVYTSLHRLYEQEVTAASELEVLRRKSGKPQLHVGGEVGVKLAYWEASPLETERTLSLYKLSLGIERSSATLYQPLRVSDTWLPDPLELTVTDGGQSIPWQEPAPILIPTNATGDAMAVDGDQKLLDLHFAAKLEPPVLLPLQVASDLLQSFGVVLPRPSYYSTWHAMLLDPSTSTPFNAMSGPAITCKRNVLAVDDGEETETTHTYVLDAPKPDAGYKLQELPFSHPRQLVELLPVLRQWACFESLVKTLFAVNTASYGKDSMASNQKSSRAGPTSLNLDDILTPPASPPSSDEQAISISLATLPVPTLSFTFAKTAGGQACNIAVQVLPNGVINVRRGASTAGDGGMEDVEDVEAKTLTKALEACSGDVGAWIQWARNRSR